MFHTNGHEMAKVIHHTQAQIQDWSEGGGGGGSNLELWAHSGLTTCMCVIIIHFVKKGDGSPPSTTGTTLDHNTAIQLYKSFTICFYVIYFLQVINFHRAAHRFLGHYY